MVTIILLIINFTGIIFLAFFKSYFTEKGKRIAVKEDIEEITTKVENIKSDFQKENTELNAKLQHLLTIQQGHRNEERNVIIDFYRTYNESLYSMIYIKVDNYQHFNINELVDKRILIDNNAKAIHVPHSLLKLLLKNEPIVIKSNLLILEIITFKAFIDASLFKLQKKLREYESIDDNISELMPEYENAENTIKGLESSQEKIEIELKEIRKDFYTNLALEFKKVLPANNEFTQMVKEYLTKIN